MAKLNIIPKIGLFIVLILVIIITGMYLRKAGIIQENFSKHGKNKRHMPRNG